MPPRDSVTATSSRLLRTRRAACSLAVMLALGACRATGLDSLEPGMRPEGVHRALGHPVQTYIENIPGAYVRKLLIEQYASPPGHILHLTYAIPADIDELALQGDLEWARRLAPELTKGISVAELPAATRAQIHLRCARLLRYRRLALRDPGARGRAVERGGARESQ